MGHHLRNLSNILGATYALMSGFLRSKIFARKKYDARVRKPKKEKNVRFRIQIWKERSI